MATENRQGVEEAFTLTSNELYEIILINNKEKEEKYLQQKNLPSSAEIYVSSKGCFIPGYSWPNERWRIWWDRLNWNENKRFWFYVNL